MPKPIQCYKVEFEINVRCNETLTPEDVKSHLEISMPALHFREMTTRITKVEKY